MSDSFSAPAPAVSAHDDSPISREQDVGAGPLRCQWCSVPLADGMTTCPTCGSPGIPDPEMTVVGLTDLDDESTQPDPLQQALSEQSIAGGEAGLVEWWNNDVSGANTSGTQQNPVSLADVENRRIQTLGFIGGAVLILAILGWLIGPSLLEGPFESLTGTTVDDPSDLRGMGAFGGLITGMFIGATGGWVVWSTK